MSEIAPETPPDLPPLTPPVKTAPFRPAPLDFWKELKDAGVIDAILKAVDELAARLPAGIKPNPGQLEAIFKQYVNEAVVNAIVGKAIVELQAALFSGHSAITKDDSALA